MAQPSTIIDLSYLQEASGGDVGMLDQIVGGYLKEMAQSVGQLEQLANDEDWPALMRAAHSLSGSAASLGAGRLRAGSVRLEDLVRHSARPGTAQLLITVIKQEHQRLEELIERSGIEGLAKAPPSIPPVGQS